MNSKYDLRRLKTLYDRLARDLERQYRDLAEGRLTGPAEALLSEDLEAQISAAGEILGRREVCGDSERDHALALQLKEQAGLLLEAVARNAGEFRRIQHAVSASLQDVKRGTHYAKSVRAGREKHPMFIDALQ